MKATKINKERAAKLIGYFYGRITSTERKQSTVNAGDVAAIWHRALVVAYIAGALKDNYNPVPEVEKVYNKAYHLGRLAPCPLTALQKKIGETVKAKGAA